MIDDHMRALLSQGAACVRVAKAGKVPVGKAWQTLASGVADVIGRWIDCGYNVGLLLGHGGLVDVEYDDADGRQLLERLGLASVKTPTYTSDRGEHRIFRLAEDLPACGWRKFGGLELRLGGKPAQSVLPPSLHPSGTTYRWKISPVDCEPMPLHLSTFEVCR